MADGSTSPSHGAAEPPEAPAPAPGNGADDAASWYYELDSGDHDEDDDPDYHDEPDEDDDEDDEFHDADDHVRFEVVIENDDDDDDDDEDEDEDADDDDEADGEVSHPLAAALRAARGTGGLLTGAQLMALLRTSNLRHVLLANDEDGDDDEDDEYGNEVDEFLSYWRPRRRRQTPKDPARFPKVPSEEGNQLLRTGVFGANDYSNRRRKKQLVRRVLERELAIGDREQRKRNNDLMTQEMVPGTRAEQIIHHDERVYSGQFSEDGNFFFSCSQDFNVRMYDTSNPYDWKHYKTASYPWGQWTLTDASLSPDNKWLAYSSIQSMVSIAPTDPNDTGDPYTLDLDDGAGNRTAWGWRGGGSFGIFSVRFSGDGRELVAGTNAHSLVVYDIESRRVLHHIAGHEDDVNAVCFADKLSPNILYSGSDDATIKVWDRRSLGDRREVGAFIGHLEGITYIDSKGDGRYILSNGKDQSMKLWDLRMKHSQQRFEDIGSRRSMHSSAGFDYRRGRYDDGDWDVLPDDNSIMTFRGHRVLRTLIRCHFSPQNSTNSHYVYSGSADGKVYIYNMDGTIEEVIDVKKASMGTRAMDRRTRMNFDEPGEWGTCVRDASWHPSAPLIVASAWNGYGMARGSCTVHSFNESAEDEGEPPIGRSVSSMLGADEERYHQATY